MPTIGRTIRGVALGLVVILASPIGAAATGSAPVPAAAAVGTSTVDRGGDPGIAPAGVALAIDFGQVPVTTTAAAIDWIYGNSTGTAQTVTASIDGPNAADFAISGGTCDDGPVADGSTCTVSVTFTPSAEYARAATLHVMDTVPSTTNVALTGVGILPASSVAWGPVRNIGGAYTSTNGTALARTTSGATQYLHAILERYDMTRWGIYYRRSTNGTTWVNPVRLNPTTQYGVRSAVAAAGSHVYAVWSTFASASPKGTAPRPLWFRMNAKNGAGTWAAARRLTPAASRIDYPKIAATGANVYISYTDSATGIVYVKVSHNYGATFTTVSLGTTTRSGWSGRTGVPAVAAYGTTVAVTWMSSSSGVIRFRSSTNRGTSWSKTSTLGTGAIAGTWPSISAVGTRVAVSWSMPTAMAVRVRTGTTWGPVRLVRPSADAGQPYSMPWIGQVLLNGSSRVAVAFEGCWAGCGAADPASAFRSDILWRESANNGVSWAHSQVVFESSAGAFTDFTQAYLPSVVWASASTRYVMAAHWNASMLLDNIVVRAGAGTP
jgi:hypothetical protein